MSGGVILIIVSLIVLVSRASTSQDVVESELSQLPKLFHLDDYERCMDREDGIFCLGQFLVYSEVENHPTYDLIQKYVHHEGLYNRSYIHRGYCLPERCAGAGSNLSARFERCVDNWAKQRHGLRARLMHLSYCKEQGKPLPSDPDTQDVPHRAFVIVVVILLALNIIGTTYDLNVEGKEKNRFLMLWSIRESYRKLVKPLPLGADDRSEALNGIKTVMAVGPMYCHSTLFTTAVYQKNPRYMEKYLSSPAGPGMGTLTTLTQNFTMMSTFLPAYSILSSPHLSWSSLPKLVLKRLTRILPVYLLVIGFAATWYTSMGDGPMWAHMAHTESAICRRKFWLSAFFLQHVVDPKNICLVQTWSIAVDMQLYIPMLVLSMLVQKYRRHAAYILSAALAASIAITYHLVFTNNYVPAYTYMTPEGYREAFLHVDTFAEFFISPFNCLISGVLGVWTALWHKSLQERGVILGGRFLGFLAYACHLSLYVISYYTYYINKIREPVFLNSMMLVERIGLGLIVVVYLILLINVNTKFISFLRWDKLRPFARMSLAASMVHWCVNAIIMLNRHSLAEASFISMWLDTVGVFVVSFMVGLPLTLMVSIPAQRTLDKIIDWLL